MVAVGIKIAHAAWTREEKFNTDIILALPRNVGKIKYQILFSTVIVEKLFAIPSVSV